MSEGSVSGSSVFVPGEVVNDRFRIIRLIGKGGGGEVYEAEDLELGDRIAVKTIRSDLVEDNEVGQRFKREIQLARKVTHRNVCRIFDVFHCTKRSPDRSQRNITFLTMELLEGNTLSEIMRKNGAMTQEQALPLIRQIAAGLSAAHQAGIIHRDLKPDNILLLQQADGSPRAVIMDFGLAFSGSGGSDRLTQAGTIVGTPAYMAPEQLQGETLSPAADIYAFGVLMFEMMTGTHPYASDSIVTTLTRKLKDERVSPRSLATNLDKTWENVILKCLEYVPAGRFSTADEIIEVLEGRRYFPRFSVITRSQTWRLARILILVIAVAAVVTRTGLWQSKSTVKMRRSVAVIGFQNLVPRAESAWLSTALSEMFTTELGQGDRLRTISGENVARMKLELKLPEMSSLAKDTLRQIRKNLNADLVVLGSYAQIDSDQDSIRLDIRLQDTGSGETIIAFNETGSEANLFDLVSRAGTRMREAIGIESISGTELEVIRASLPSQPEALRLYSQGLIALRTYEFMQAKDLLTKTISIEPGFPPAHSALAESWSSLGYDHYAAEESRKAVELSTAVSREDRLLIEARHHYITGDYRKAAEIYKSLFTFYPDNPDFALDLANSLQLGGQDAEALQIISSVKSVIDDPRIDLLESEIEISDNTRRALASLDRACAKAEARNMQLILARCRTNRGFALYNLGELEPARNEFIAAQQLFVAASDPLNAAECLNGIALVNLSIGDLQAALEQYDEVLKTALKVGNISFQVTALHNLSSTLRQKGELIEAEKRGRETLAALEQLPDKSGVRTVWRNIAAVLAEQGRLEESKALYNQALSPTGYPESRAATAALQYGLGQVLAAEGNLIEAKKLHEESLNARIEMEHQEAVAISKTAIAALLIEETKFQEAQVLLRVAGATFSQLKQKSDEGFTYVLMARSSLEQRNIAEAQKRIDAASTLLKDTQFFTHKAMLKIVSASILTAGGKTEDAILLLNQVIKDAQRFSIVELQLEATLALAEAELLSGNSQTAKQRLLALQKEATKRNYGLIARKASQLQRM